MTQTTFSRRGIAFKTCLFVIAWIFLADQIAISHAAMDALAPAHEN